MVTAYEPVEAHNMADMKGCRKMKPTQTEHKEGIVP